MISKIISGGQTGADQGGLAAAKALGIATGGYMPRGFRTEAGPRPDLAAEYGMQENVSAEYPPRTRANVLVADATVIFGDATSSGSRLTSRLCRAPGRPLFYVSTTDPAVWTADETIQAFRDWLANHRVGILNVAGNRESKQPGIHDAVRDFLIAALGPTDV